MNPWIALILRRCIEVCSSTRENIWPKYLSPFMSTSQCSVVSLYLLYKRLSALCDIYLTNHLTAPRVYFSTRRVYFEIFDMPLYLPLQRVFLEMFAPPTLALQYLPTVAFTSKCLPSLPKTFFHPSSLRSFGSSIALFPR